MAQTSIETKIKAYLAPILIAAFGTISMSILMDMKTDIKTLLAHDNTQIVQIETLKSDIAELKDKFKKLEEDIRYIQILRGHFSAIKTKILVLKNKKFKYESI